MGVSWTQSELGWVVGHTSQEVGGAERQNTPSCGPKAGQGTPRGWVG